jgi:hypothetical protein
VWHAKGEINGRLYRESTGFRVDSGKTGRTAALAALNLIENRIRSRLAGLTPPAAAPTFREYWEQTYRPTYTTRKRAPERDDQVMAHALPTFGAFTLDAIRKSD